MRGTGRRETRHLSVLTNRPTRYRSRRSFKWNMGATRRIQGIPTHQSGEIYSVNRTSVSLAPLFCCWCCCCLWFTVVGIGCLLGLWIFCLLSFLFSKLYLTDAIWSLAHKCLFLIISSPVILYICVYNFNNNDNNSNQYQFWGHIYLIFRKLSSA